MNENRMRKLRIQHQQDKTGDKGFKGRQSEFERHSGSGYENSGQKAKRVQADVLLFFQEGSSW